MGHIYNLFSNFGNIKKILYSPTLYNSALVEYSSIDASSLAKHFVHNLNFFSGQLKVFSAKYDTINVKSTTPSSDVFTGGYKTDRFRDNRPLYINPPSDSLHLSNLVHEACKEELILPLLAAFGNIIAFRFLHDGRNKNMCLVRFSNVHQASNALASLHNYNIFGRNLQISFTRSKF